VAVSPEEERVFLLALSKRPGVEESNGLTRCPSCGTMATLSSSYCWACGDPMTASEDRFAEDDSYSWV
jgi:predicted amidophosphoribosyltransferase